MIAYFLGTNQQNNKKPLLIQKNIQNYTANNKVHIQICKLNHIQLSSLYSPVASASGCDYCSLLLQLFVERKDLRHMTDTFAGALPEQDSLARLHVLGMADETKQYGCTVIGADPLSAHNARNNGRLTDAANVDGRLETDVDGRGMKEDGDFCLAGEYKMYDRKFGIFG